LPSISPIQLEVFKHLFAAVAEEMGALLRKASYSPNIKERRDFSCAVFDSQGRMIAQAAHIPVHLGSMPLSVLAAIHDFPDLQPGDSILLNDPFRGGTHLPDITLVDPVFLPDGQLYGFAASRAHHADVGGMSAGSMPLAREIFQEGLIIPPVRLFEAGRLNQSLLDMLLANVRTPQERSGDLWAQIACNRRGAVRMSEIASRYGIGTSTQAMDELRLYTARMTRSLLQSIPNGSYTFTDFMDNDGISADPVPITVKVTISGDRAVVDFSGSAPQQTGSINAVYAITLSAVYYVFRCLIGLDVPNNSGCLEPIEVIAPEGTVVNALPPAAVSAGNVETSQRIVDVLLGALAQACPEKVTAASQGTMNNLLIGGYDDTKKRPFAYYETIAGGMGAGPQGDGAAAMHSHMTNTLNTPVEALEFAYPLRVLRYEIRQHSGGEGAHHGGDGIRRDIQLLEDAQATIVSERRVKPPYGLNGGEDGQCGQNVLIHEGEEQPLPGKGSFYLKKGDILSLRTPGGGGYGRKSTADDRP
jgi:N-methylhydantoinase B